MPTPVSSTLRTNCSAIFSDPQEYEPPPGREFQGVEDQVQNRLLQFVAVKPDGAEVPDCTTISIFTPFGVRHLLGGAGHEACADKVAHSQRLLLHLHPPGFQTDEVKANR